MGNYAKFTCLVCSSLINILRCPGGSRGCGLGEVGLPIYCDRSLTHSFSTSSKWILSIVAIAWVGSIATYVTLLALGSAAYSINGMPSQFTTALSNI